MSGMDALRETFHEECADLLASYEADLLACGDDEPHPENIDRMFRAVHSIKGGAGAFDLHGLGEYAHETESVLDAIRGGRLEVTPDVVDVLLGSVDRLRRLLSDSSAPREDSALSALAARPAVRGGEAHVFTPLPAAFDFADDASPPVPAGPGRDWTIRFAPGPAFLRDGHEPLYLLRSLRELGDVAATVEIDDLPDFASLEVDRLCLGWTIRLRTADAAVPESEIAAIFEFADDRCALDIVAEAEERQNRPAPPQDPPATSDGGAAEARSATSIRVDLARIERLVNLAGELVIRQSMFGQTLAVQAPDMAIGHGGHLDELQQLTRDIQESVMSIRAQPVRSLFQRMARVVREAGATTGKPVRLVTEGAATEIDKTVVELLTEPLTHLVRNAVDHGIEPPDVRTLAGKPAEGTVTLNAVQQSGRVVIEISDDGGGIDRDAVLARAKRRGLVAEDAMPSEAEIDRLLFVPGFTTRDAVSELSGRGVGMDVIHRAVRDLNGAIAIDTTQGRGTRITISLPLTLAILDGMIVRSRGHRLVVPLSAIVETQDSEFARIETLPGGRRVVAFQGGLVPVLEMTAAMGFAEDVTAVEAPMAEPGVLLILHTDESGPFALRTDAIETQHQVVIKGIGQTAGDVPGVSAATILGDGAVALIADPIGIARMAGFAHPHHVAPRCGHHGDAPAIPAEASA